MRIKNPAFKGGPTKFKVRTGRYLYTLKVNDAAKAEKLKLTLPPGVDVKTIKQ